MADARRRCWQTRLWESATLGGFATVLTTLFDGGTYAAERGQWLASLQDVLHRLPSSIVIGGLVASLGYFLLFRRKTMVCATCGAAKLADGNLHCPCGGKFESLEKMKWIEKGKR